MSFLKRITSFLIILFFFAFAVVPASAASLTEPESTGSIQVRLIYQGEPVSGGTITLYRVGDLTSDGAGFVPSGEFQDCNTDLTSVGDPGTAETLLQYAREHSISGNTRNVDKSGTVRFTDLPTGLYLLVQWESALNYDPIQPFLVSIPLAVGENLYYDIDASPKVTLKPQPPAQTTPTEPVKPTLPQTGQLNWPIPVMAVCGTVLLGMGGILCFKKRKMNEK